jgi:DNA repair exonuclease SbcCD ATPase subunit
MQFGYISLKNFLSFEDLYYKFTNDPVIIRGRNLRTIEGQEVNGTGKSSFQCGLEYAWEGTTSRKSTSKKWVRRGTKLSEVESTLYCPIRNETLLIERLLSKTGGKVQLSVIKGEHHYDDEKHESNIKFAFEDKMGKEIKKFIFDWIDITAEDFKSYYLINKAKYKSYFSLSNTEKVALSARFSNAKIIDGVGDLVQEDVDKLNRGLRKLQDKNIAIQSTIDTHNYSIKEEENKDLEGDRAERIAEIDEFIVDEYDKIDEIKESISEKNILAKSKNEDLLDFQSSLEEVQKELKSFKGANLSKEYEAINKERSATQKSIIQYNKKRNSLTDNIDEVNGIISDINKNILGAVKCPKCSHEFVVGQEDANIEDVNIEDEKEELKASRVMCEQFTKSLKTVKDLVGEFRLVVKDLDEEESVLSQKETKLKTAKLSITRKIEKVEKSISSHNSALARISNQIKNYESSVENHKETITSLKQQKKDWKEKILDNSGTIREFKKKIVLEEKDLEANKEEITLKETEIFETEQWVHNFTRFYLHLANKSLKVIEGYCNKALIEMRSDMQIKMEGLKELANGKLKESITPIVYRSGEPFDIGDFSDGELGRLDYAMIIAQQEILNRSSKWGGINLLWTDDSHNGMDGLGHMSIAKSLAGAGRTVLMTCQIELAKTKDIDVITFEKGADEISKLIQE